jgi:hypothetical protein
MQLDRQLVSKRNLDFSKNYSFYLEHELGNAPASFFLNESQQVAKTMQESLGIKPVDSMAKARPIWKRLYIQWSKQLLHI